LQPYIKNKDVFRCADTASTVPMDLTFAARKTAPSIGMNSYLGLYFNYFYDVTIKGDESNPAYPRPVRDSLIQYPSETVLFADAFDRPAGAFLPRAYWIDPAYRKG